MKDTINITVDQFNELSKDLIIFGSAFVHLSFNPNIDEKNHSELKVEIVSPSKVLIKDNI